MMKTLPPPPLPPAPRTQGWGDHLIDGVGRVLTYPLRRLVARPSRGWVWVVGVPACVLLGNHLLWVVAMALHRPNTRLPDQLFLLRHPLSLLELLGYSGVVGLVLLADRWPRPWPHLRFRREFPWLGLSAAASPPSPEVAPDLWGLGRPYDRVWNEETNAFELLPDEAAAYTLSAGQLCTHLIIIAPTGMGKTRSVLEPSLAYLDRIGAGGIYLDAKGDDFSGPAFEQAHPHAFHLRFRLDDPERSFPLQLWSGQTPYEMAERLGEALLPELAPDQQYFADNARNALIGLVLAHHRVYEAMPGLPSLLQYLRDTESRERLARSLPKRAEELFDLQRIAQLTGGRYDVLGSLDAALQPLARRAIARLFAAPGEGYAVADLLRAPARVCFTLPVGRYPRVARILGRLIVAQFTHAVLDPAVNRHHYKFLVVDEAHNFVTRAIAAGMAQARSNRAGYLLAFQDLAQLRDETLVDDLLSNAGIKIVMGGVGERDAHRFSLLFGAPERAYRSQTASTGQSASRSHTSGRSHASSLAQSGHGQAQQHGSSWSRQTHARPTFSPWEIRSLAAHHAIIERRDSQGHFTPPTVVHFDLPYVERIRAGQLQALFGPDPPAVCTQIIPACLRAASTIPESLTPAPEEPTPAEEPTAAAEHTTQPQEEAEATVLMEAAEAPAPDRSEAIAMPDAPEPAEAPVETFVTESAVEDATPAGPLTRAEQIEVNTRQILAALQMDAASARKLATRAARAGREAGYIPALLQQVVAASNGDAPETLFRYRVGNNLDATALPTEAAVASQVPTE